MKKTTESEEKRVFLTPEDAEAFEPAEKIGIIATVNPEGKPHATLITTIQAKGSDELIVGQFCKGQSKENLLSYPKTSFLILSLDRKLWRGKAEWFDARKEGDDYQKLNMIPMFRYNTYFGINTVHYFTLKEISGPGSLPMVSIIRSALLTKITKRPAVSSEPEILNNFALTLFSKLDSLIFLTYIGSDGYPEIIPVIQMQPAGNSRLVFSPGAFREDLSRIPDKTETAVLCVNLQMQSILVRGTYQGVLRMRGSKLGIIDISWVYNSMPPAHGQIYPEVPLEAVENFGSLFCE